MGKSKKVTSDNRSSMKHKFIQHGSIKVTADTLHKIIKLTQQWYATKKQIEIK